MTFNILLSGGIGTKILRLIAGCGEAIERGIKPEEICLIDKYYSRDQSNHTGVFYTYHNTEDIFDYVKVNIGCYSTNVDQFSVKKYDHDKHMVNFILAFLSSPHLCDHRNPRDYSSKSNSAAFWVRGKDRPSNIDLFARLVSSFDAHDSELKVFSNDKELLQNCPKLYEFYSSTTSLNDFHSLLNSSSIYTQMSGFTLAPFLLSPRPQKLVLLDKSHHSSVDYPFLDKDWKFYSLLFNGILEHAHPNKIVKVLK